MVCVVMSPLPVMFFRYLLLLLLALFQLPISAQTPSDTARVVALPEATVTGYGQRLLLRRTAPPARAAWQEASVASTAA